ncbi:hypothetical protein [Echinicola rosea]|nr:hypothetical protein [Echinicola rosea]
MSKKNSQQPIVDGKSYTSERLITPFDMPRKFRMPVRSQKPSTATPCSFP